MKELNIFILLFTLHATVREGCTEQESASTAFSIVTPVPIDDVICTHGSKCVPQIQCPQNVLDKIKPTYCHIKSERTRVCCMPKPNITDISDVRSRDSAGKPMIHIPNNLLSECLRKAEADSLDLLTKLRILNHDKNSQVPKGSPSFTHSKNSKFQNEKEMREMLKISEEARKLITASQEVKKKARFGNHIYERDLIRHRSLRNYNSLYCHDVPKCPLPYSKYRSLDGTCNNPINGNWGAARTRYSRLLPPLYDDGVYSVRKSFYHRHPLPSARLVSSTVFTDEDHIDYTHTQMLMTFGQFITHDLTHSIPTTLYDGSPINCCPSMNSTDMYHPACLPIYVSSHDPFYGEFNISCINFVRSLLAPKDSCSLGYAEQLNRVTHFLDGSVIYGTSPEILFELREHKGGRLKMFLDFNRQLLPLSKLDTDCLMRENGFACFTSGDSRVNQMISLTAVHLLFAREHNRVAGILEKMNVHWDDEKIFLEARKIVVGELQHIVYSEWLPEIIGHEAMHEFGLIVTHRGYSNDYDPYVNPSITTEFATAAFRFGHSIVDGKIKLYGKYKMEEIIDLPEVMFSPGRLRMKFFFDELLSSLTLDPIQMADAHASSALSKYMFRGGNPFGMDLFAINIQRGRDHGLKTYNQYRELVGLPKFHYFEDFGHKAGAVLKFVYESVDDVDLYVGGLLEPPFRDTVVGRTFRDMIADQFFRLKKGDRYFYNLSPLINPGHFTPGQLDEIKKASMSRIICDNSDHLLLHRQAINAFRKPGAHGNRIVDCRHDGYGGIPRINFAAWKDLY